VREHRGLVNLSADQTGAIGSGRGSRTSCRSVVTRPAHVLSLGGFA
jgi:hypothetical protein